MISLEENEKNYIEKVFIENDKIIFKAAKVAGINRNKFAYLIKKYGIEKRIKDVSDELHNRIIKAVEAYGHNEDILYENSRGKGALIKYFAFIYLYKNMFVELKGISERYKIVDFKISATINKYQAMIEKDKNVRLNFEKFCSFANNS